MSGQRIETEKVTINKLFTDYWFRVPEYQRSYVWGKDQLDDLLDDLRFACEHNREKEYFLGSIVLQKRQEQHGQVSYPCYDVLDGQQRLTTLFLLMAVMRDVAKDRNLQQNAATKIFQEEDPFANQPERIRIEFLIRDGVGEFINELIKPLEGTQDKKRLEEYAARSNVSLSNMASAILYLHQCLQDFSEGELRQFAIFLFNQVIVIYVASESMEDAFRLFTILNDRGIPLSNSDILKSLNIGALPERQRAYRAREWEQWEAEFGRDGFDRFLGYIRTIIIKDKPRESLLEAFERLYKEKKLEQGEKTFRLLQEYYSHFQLLFWSEEKIIAEDYKLRNLLKIMQLGLGATDWLPLLMFFYERFRAENLLFFMQKLESKVSADWILRRSHTKRLVNLFNILKAIERSPDSASLLQEQDIFDYSREEVKQALEQPLYAEPYARYIMLKIEYILQDHSNPFPTFQQISIEHILPQNPREESTWLQWFSEEERHFWAHRLANLVLLSRRKNASLSNYDFEKKKSSYFSSSIATFPNVVTVMQESEWRPEQLKKRQQDLLARLMDSFL